MPLTSDEGTIGTGLAGSADRSRDMFPEGRWRYVVSGKVVQGQPNRIDLGGNLDGSARYWIDELEVVEA
jgi:hypothetical protein